MHKCQLPFFPLFKKFPCVVFPKEFVALAGFSHTAPPKPILFISTGSGGALLVSSRIPSSGILGCELTLIMDVVFGHDHAGWLTCALFLAWLSLPHTWLGGFSPVGPSHHSSLLEGRPPYLSSTSLCTLVSLHTNPSTSELEATSVSKEVPE